MTLRRLVALCGLVLCAPGALAGRVEIPLRVPFEAIRQALGAQLAASPSRPGVIYREGPCRHLDLETPRLEALDGKLRLFGPGSAALGVELLGKCRNAAAWRGSVEFLLAPHLDNSGRLRLRILDSKLTDESGEPAFGFIWELSKRYLHPRLERFSYDVGAFRTTLVSLLRSAAPAEHGAELELALRELQVLEPRVETNAVAVPIAFGVPDAWLAAPAAAAARAAPLSEAEIDALDKALQPWDAFLANSIKQVALDSPDSALRKRLFTLLLESRYQLVAILAGEAPATGDPVRALFIDAWNELRAILADARYAVFVDAGDALMTLDRAAPGLGMTLSADGLRQLARTLHPGAKGDPLGYDWAVDPQLRRLFEVEDIPQQLEPAPAPRSWLDFFVKSAHAAARALDRWVPGRDELEAYGERIEELLQQTSAGELQRTDLAAPYDEIYRHLVPTTALIESCWRQYVQRNGKTSFLRSAVGSVGIMQVNERVWRGFYDVERLRWNTGYNMRAGARILMRYMKDYAIPYGERSGELDHIPRAAYAVYNAGPRAAGRFNKDRRHPREARVDDKLWTLYQGIAAGAHADLSTCGVAAAGSQ
jgi:hypothetical protein